MVKGLVECIQFNTHSVILATNLFKTIPQYVIISVIGLSFLFIIGLFSLLFYYIYIYRKFNSIDNHTNKKYNKSKEDDNSSKTYKEDKKEYKKDVSELEAKVMPDGQTAINVIDKVIEFKNKK